jgi:hypothetical protein
MRNATLVLDAATVMCPGCRDAVPEPVTHSEMWTAADLARQAGRGMDCPFCGVTFALPRTLKVEVV